MVALAGCSALPGDDAPATEDDLEVADDDPGATNVTQSLVFDVDESAAGTELTEVAAVYPREAFDVDAAGHEEIRIAVDTDDDGEAEERFDESHVSGVNTNEYSYTVTLDTGYTLDAGDTVLLEYPAVDNPDEPGNYTVELTLNEEHVENGTVTVA